MRSTRTFGHGYAPDRGQRAALGCSHGLPSVRAHARTVGFRAPPAVRGHDGTIELRPRRARCRGCRTTHVMLPASCPPRRPVTVQIVGQAVLLCPQADLWVE